MHQITIRKAVADDTPILLTLIRELAEFEKLEHEVTADEQTLKHHLFGPTPRAQALLADADIALAGFCVYFYDFSTFLGSPGLYIEDIYVRPRYRGMGIGKRIFEHLAGVAKENGCARMQWQALDWNRNAIDFYASYGAKPLSGWTTFRLAKDRFPGEAP